MNSKKLKREKEEKLLISYSGEDRGRSSESENNVPPLDLPPTRLRRPRPRKLHITQPSKNWCSPWSALQMIFVVFTLGTMISMIWFTLILKTSLESMRKRITSLESTDRSTSREYEGIKDDLTQKYEFLKVSKEDTMKQEGEHYKSILRQIAYLNSTVNDLQNRVKLPEGAQAISSDIESLKKGMADTGGDITEIKDKIKQLTDVTSQQQNKVHEVSKHLYNLTIQVAQISGRPPPKVPPVTGTPPLILQMPPSADENGPAKEKLSFNVSALISVKVAGVMGTVTTVNNTLSSEVDKLRFLMKNLLKEVKKHMAAVDELQSEVSNVLKPDHSSVVSRGHLEMDSGSDFQEHIHNLSMIVSKLTLDMDQQSKKLAGLVVQVNNSAHQAEPAVVEKPVTCNCSGEMKKLWEALSINKQTMESLKRELQALKEEKGSNDNDTEKEIILENPSDEVQPRVNSTIINHQNVTTETELELKVQDIGDSTNSSVNSTLLPGVMSTPSPKHPVNSSDEGTVNTRVHGAQPTNTTYPPTVSIRSAKSKLSTVASGVANDSVTDTSLSAEEKFENNLESPGSE